MGFSELVAPAVVFPVNVGLRLQLVKGWGLLARALPGGLGRPGRCQRPGSPVRSLPSDQPERVF